MAPLHPGEQAVGPPRAPWHTRLHNAFPTSLPHPGRSRMGSEVSQMPVQNQAPNLAVGLKVTPVRGDQAGWGGQDGPGAGSKRVGVPESAGTPNRRRGTRVHSRQPRPFGASAGLLREHSSLKHLTPDPWGADRQLPGDPSRGGSAPLLCLGVKGGSDGRVRLSPNASWEGALEALRN